MHMCVSLCVIVCMYMYILCNCNVHVRTMYLCVNKSCIDLCTCMYVYNIKVCIVYIHTLVCICILSHISLADIIVSVNMPTHSLEHEHIYTLTLANSSQDLYIHVALPHTGLIGARV